MRAVVEVALDSATFLVGDSIGMSFVRYLQTVSLGGLLSVVVIIPLLPLLMPDLWRLQRALPPEMPAKPLERPGFALPALLLDIAGRLWAPADGIAWLSPFRYFIPFDIVMGSELPVENTIVLCAIAMTGFVLAYFLFTQRDISH